MTPARRKGRIPLERLHSQPKDLLTAEVEVEELEAEQLRDEPLAIPVEGQGEKGESQGEKGELAESNEEREVEQHKGRNRGRRRRRRGRRANGDDVQKQLEESSNELTEATKAALDEDPESKEAARADAASDEEETQSAQDRRAAARARNQEASRRRRRGRGNAPRNEETAQSAQGGELASREEPTSADEEATASAPREEFLPATEGSSLASLKKMAKEILQRSRLQIPADVERLKKEGAEPEAIELARQTQRRFSRDKVTLDALRIIARQDVEARESVAAIIEPLLGLDRWGKVRGYLAQELGPFEEPEAALYFKGTSERAFQSGPLQRLTLLPEGQSLLSLYPAGLIEELEGRSSQQPRRRRRRRGGRRSGQGQKRHGARRERA